MSEEVSPLTQGRGLKLNVYGEAVYLALSPLTQGRGLKPANCRLEFHS